MEWNPSLALLVIGKKVCYCQRSLTTKEIPAKDLLSLLHLLR